MTDLDNETKMKLKISAIQKRNEKREENISKMRTDEVEKGTERINEKVEDFHANLDPMLAQIKDMMNRSEQTDKTLINAHLDELRRRINDAQKFVTDATHFLPAYETRTAQKSLNDLNQEFQERQSVLLPKKKFGFKGAKQRKTVSSELTVEQSADQTDLGSKDVKSQIDFGFSVQDKVNESVELTESDANQADVHISNLERCTVRILGTPSTIHFTNIRNCRVVAAPVSSSIFIENCRQSKLALSSQQLRVHNCIDSDFYIHVTSKAVIEDCTNLRFGQNPFLNEFDDRLWTQSALDRTINNWDQVGDFNWLAKDKPSPNWSRLEGAVSNDPTAITWLSSVQFLQQ